MIWDTVRHGVYTTEDRYAALTAKRRHYCRSFRELATALCGIIELLLYI
jgi:hypothetical protein